MRSASRLTRAGTTDRMLFVIGSSSACNRSGAKRNLRVCREASEANRSVIAARLLGGNTRGNCPTSGWPTVRTELSLNAAASGGANAPRRTVQPDHTIERE